MNRALVKLLLLAGLCGALMPVQAATDCRSEANAHCFFALTLPGTSLQLHYYASLDPQDTEARPSAALIVMHGHPRDAMRSFDSGWRVVQQAGQQANILVVAPLFQVDGAHDQRCHFHGEPSAQAGDALWTCSSWLNGGTARNARQLTSFAALDALVAHLQQRWPSLQTITVAGFSAGAQVVQRWIGFAADTPAHMRYIVADPGSWLYFDAERPQPQVCAGFNDWKYGTDHLPANLGRDAQEARARYARAEIHYVAGALDQDGSHGNAASVLDQSCAAEAQGPFRLQRAEAYVAYDHRRLAPAATRELTVAPGCKHDVTCVFAVPAVSALLLNSSHRP